MGQMVRGRGREERGRTGTRVAARNAVEQEIAVQAVMVLHGSGQDNGRRNRRRGLDIMGLCIRRGRRY